MSVEIKPKVIVLKSKLSKYLFQFSCLMTTSTTDKCYHIAIVKIVANIEQR